MIDFIIGALVGAMFGCFMGVMLCALLVEAKESEDRMNQKNDPEQ